MDSRRWDIYLRMLDRRCSRLAKCSRFPLGTCVCWRSSQSRKCWGNRRVGSLYYSRCHQQHCCNEYGQRGTHKSKMNTIASLHCAAWVSVQFVLQQGSTWWHAAYNKPIDSLDNAINRSILIFTYHVCRAAIALLSMFNNRIAAHRDSRVEAEASSPIGHLNSLQRVSANGF